MKFSVTFFYIAAIVLLSSCQAEEELVLQEGEIHGALHEANIGRITFMEEAIPIEDYSEKDFLTTIELRDKVDLNIRVFLGKTLTYYLHELAPELSVSQLCRKGNYQFSFYVDGKMIYRENLTPGAGSCWYKNEMTIFRVPLISSSEEDSWGRFLWTRFMKKGGGEEALAEGSHALQIEIRPYVETSELKVGNIIARGEAAIKMFRKEVGESQVAIQPIAPNSGWNVSKESFNTEKIRELNKRIARGDFRDITSIVAIKNGKLLLEEYFNGAGRASLHDTRSVGKSFVSALTGIAISEGHIKSETAELKDFYQLGSYENYSGKKGKVTIKSLLSMSSGFDGSDMDPDSPGNEEKMYPASDWVAFTLNLPMDSKREVGEKWAYFTAGVVVLGDILNTAVPGGLEEYANQKLFGPLGIEAYQWQYTPQNVPNTAGGLQMKALDLAKYGQLFKNGGTWNGRRLLPEKWVASSLARQIALPGEIGGYYGYLFWNKDYQVAGRHCQVAYASGNGGNKIFIFKDEPLVVVVTAKAYNQPYSHVQVDQMMEEFILPSILN